MTNLSSTAQAQASATGDLFSPSLTGFAKEFAVFDREIMDTLGDQLKLTAPGGYVLNPQCILSAYPGVSQDGFAWSDNITAKVDIYTVLLNVLECDVPGIAKNWTARYNDKDYVVTDFVLQGDGILTLLLNPPGSPPAAGNWK